MKHKALLSYLLILFWLSALLRTDALYVAYLALGLAGAYAVSENQKNHKAIPSGRGWVLVAVPVAFSAAVLCAEWRRFTEILLPQDYFAVRKAAFLITVMLVALGNYLIAREILLFLSGQGGKDGTEEDAPENKDATRPADKKTKSIKMFSLFFFSLWVVDLLYLFLCAYPGNLTTDSLSQISQIVSGIYNDHHPYWYTRLIRVFLHIGVTLTGTLRGGVACYHVFQAAVLCFAFAYLLMTVYEKGVRKTRLVAAWLYYLLLPYHVLYSVTMWKDVLFAAAFTLFTTGALRLFSESDKNRLYNGFDLSLTVAGAMGICLLRSNGWLVFCGTVFVFLLVFGKQRTWPFFIILAITLMLNVLALPLLHVEKGDMLETVALPVQQVGYTAITANDLTAEEKEMIEAILPVEEIREAYDPEIVDPVKGRIREKGTLSVLENNKAGYLALWGKLAIRHPDTYLQAFISQTKGYWNAGYANYIWAQGVGGNDMGLATAEGNHIATALKNSYLWLFENIAFLQLIKCIGLYFWSAVFLAGASYLRNNRAWVFIMPYLFLFLTLLLATPVNNEFRYIYALPCILPLAATASMKLERD